MLIVSPWRRIIARRQERYRQRVLHNLAHQAKSMGMQRVPANLRSENTMQINQLSGVF